MLNVTCFISLVLDITLVYKKSHKVKKCLLFHKSFILEMKKIDVNSILFIALYLVGLF